MATAISAGDVKALRDRTGAGMMDCKAALQEAGGDFGKAVEILRVKGQAQAAKRGAREATEGVVQSYIHATGKIGALVEIDCETDFVARTDDFREFAKEVAQHIAAMGPDWVSEEHVNAEKHERKTIDQLRQELAAKTGENVRIARFAYFRVGED